MNNILLSKQISFKNRMRRLFDSDRVLWVLLALLFSVNIVHMLIVGPDFTISSDDLAYVHSGFYFRNTGIITIHEEYLTAQIMPGMPVLIAAVSAVFGEGIAFWVAIKLIMISFGTMTGYFIYKSVRIFAPPLCAALAVVPLFKPDFVCVNNQTLTEAPYIFFFSGLIYATLRIGQKRYDYGALWVATFMLALMFRANILSFPVFAIIYFALKKTNVRKLLKIGCATLLALACFVVPWSIRNFRYYNKFIPFTFGSSAPIYEGTYQGIGYPSDDEMDYSGIAESLKEDFAYCYDEDGQIMPEFFRFVSFEKSGRMAGLRFQKWITEKPLQCISSYLVIKPVKMMISIWHHGPGHQYIRWIVTLLQMLNLMLASLAVYCSFRMKKHRAPMAFLGLFYIGTVYIHSISFVSGRYNMSLLPALYVLIGVGLPQIKAFEERWKHAKKISGR